MSVIVAVSDGLRVWMAADSQATSQHGGIIIMRDPKIVRLGDVLFGADGTLAVTQAIRYGGLDTSGIADLGAWAAKLFVPWLRAWLRDHDALQRHNDQNEFPGHTLIAHGGEFVLVDGGGNIIRPACSWWAIGSGAAEARGALHALSGFMALGRAVAELAVDAACALDDGCRPPIHVEST